MHFGIRCCEAFIRPSDSICSHLDSILSQSLLDPFELRTCIQSYISLSRFVALKNKSIQIKPLWPRKKTHSYTSYSPMFTVFVSSLVSFSLSLSGNVCLAKRTPIQSNILDMLFYRWPKWLREMFYLSISMSTQLFLLIFRFVVSMPCMYWFALLCFAFCCSF